MTIGRMLVLLAGKSRRRCRMADSHGLAACSRTARREYDLPLIEGLGGERGVAEVGRGQSPELLARSTGQRNRAGEGFVVELWGGGARGIWDCRLQVSDCEEMASARRAETGFGVDPTTL